MSCNFLRLFININSKKGEHRISVQRHFHPTNPIHPSKDKDKDTDKDIDKDKDKDKDKDIDKDKKVQRYSHCY